MPIAYRVDHARRLVLLEAHGTLTPEDLFGYQREVWSNPDVAGYDELADMSRVEEITQGAPERMKALAALSASTDPRVGESRLAIVAPQQEIFGLGRMYEAYRELTGHSTKRVSVFRDRAAALSWLGRDAAPPETAPGA